MLEGWEDQEGCGWMANLRGCLRERSLSERQADDNAYDRIFMDGFCEDSVLGLCTSGGGSNF